ncbi:MAG TPA: hypothetical protein VG267_13485 [Terracidiphilus sp.]|jgi:hypothetical protein|nr:hypothetical protein [Terracidiphilus sp.]
MDLWTEFEGVTIDSAFSLKRLLQTEGRSAFFSTLNAHGESVLIRLIECHFDEDEILARWRGVQTLGHPNFLRIDRFGQFLIEADGITAVYAVFERVDENLAQVLERGRLSAADAAQIGLSVASALETLHANGFVHEHVEARTIFAVGENVKLRSDCIRETPEGAAGLDARRRDVHGLAVVLEQVLLGGPRLAHPPRQQALSAPFGEIVNKGISGEWGIAEIKAALAQRSGSKAAPPKVSLPQPASPKAMPPAAQQAVSPAMAHSRDVASRSLESSSPAKLETLSKPETPAKPEIRPETSMPNDAKAATDVSLPGRRRASMELPVVFGLSEHDFRRWLAAAALFAAVVFGGWLLMHHWFGQHAGATALPTPTTPAAATPDPPLPTPSPAPPRSASSLPAPASSAVTPGRAQWRVVAFTYNRQDQAQKKASTLAQKHPDLQPQVFSPNGRAPWLVTIGGAQQRDAAYALARRARSLGLPRDSYAQNYTAR